MELGTFSVSLAVKELAVSLVFYQNLGFEVIEGRRVVVNETSGAGSVRFADFGLQG